MQYNDIPVHIKLYRSIVSFLEEKIVKCKTDKKMYGYES